METTCRNYQAEKRVEAGSVDTANIVGPPATAPLSIEEGLNDSIEVTEHRQEENDLADAVPEDGISPDDAPEVVLGDIDEEGEEDTPTASMLKQLGRPQSSADAIEAMQARQEDEMLLGFGTLCVAGNKKAKNPEPRKHKARSQKIQRKKSNKNKKDRRLVEESILRMRSSTASSSSQSKHIELRFPQQRRKTTLLRQSGLDQEELDQHEDKLLGGPEQAEPRNKEVPLLALPRAEGAISVSRESLDKVRGAPVIEAHSDENRPTAYTTGVDATQLIVAEREKARVRVNAEVDGLLSGLRLLLDAPTDSDPRVPYDPDMDADQVDMQVDFSISVDKDGDEVEPWFGDLSNTYLDPSLAFQPLLYSHGPNIEQDDRIVEDIGPGFVADSVMEEARLELWMADASVTATQALQSFPWAPPSVSDASHTIFPGVPSSLTQMTAALKSSEPVFQHRMLNDPYAVNTTIPEETRLPQDTPLQDIAWSFTADEVHPSPPVQVRLANEPHSAHARLSPTPVPSVFTSQITSHSSFPPLSLPTSRVDPTPVSPSTCRPIEGHKEGVKALEEEIDPEPVVAVAVQREASPPRFYTHNVVGLGSLASQWRTRPSPTNSDVSLPLSPLLLAVDTTAVNHSAPTLASLIEHNEDEIKDENRGHTEDGHSCREGVHEIVDPAPAITGPTTRKPTPPIDPDATVKPSPPVPPPVAGSKRKFVEDQGTYWHSINPARKKSSIPRSKKQKIKHGDYSTHKTLGEAKARHRGQREGIEFATRRRVPAWSSAGQADTHGGFSIPMDEDESEPSDCDLSDITFDPLLAYHPHSHSHSLNIQQDDLVSEHIGLANLTVEDAGREAWKATASATATESLQPFLWTPPSASGALCGIFPGVPSGQTTALVNDSIHVIDSPVPGNPCAVGITTSEQAELQHAAPPQDITWPFVLKRIHPLLSVTVELSKEPELFIPRTSPTPVSNIFASQATSHSSFPSTSPSASRAGPIPASPFTCRPIEGHNGEVKGLSIEVGPEPAVAANVQHKASPLRSLGVYKVISLDAGVPSTANSNLSLPISSAVGTEVANYSPPTSATPTERNEYEVAIKDGAKDRHSKRVHDIVDEALECSTEKSPAPTDPVAEVKPSPPVPARIAGSKRRFVDEQGAYSTSINPARKEPTFPQSKKQKLEHGDYTTHKRLGEVKAMHRLG